MNKIKDITLSNFKFFGKKEIIKLDGKHLLLYGENGCGKSSIFWGLYTLLEASFKNSDETDKYFEPFEVSRESLVNIYAPQLSCIIESKKINSNSFIELKTMGNDSYKISIEDHGVCKNAALQESRKATDFINYQSVFKFQDFKNSETSNLYEVFTYSILPYINFNSFNLKGKDLSDGTSMWESYKKGPGTTINKKGDTILVYKHSKEYSDFLKFEKHFIGEFERLIDFINADENANSYIKKFGYNFKFSLTFTPPTHRKKDKKYEWTPFVVELKITEYNGIAVQINHPHTFLNEAKMSALAMAIRLSIIDFRINTVAQNALRVLVLDDMMISLDMSNRDSLLDLLLSEYSNKYQILFLTHDRHLFDFVNQKIKEHKQSNEWNLKEMHVTEDHGTNKESPIIIDSDSDSFAKVKKYYLANDFTTCALYIRKTLEEIITNVLPDEYCKNADGRFVELNILWKRLLQYTTSIPENIKQRFSTSRLTLLNPSAHYQKLSYPIYKRELYNAIKLIEDLNNIQISTKILLVDKNSILTFKHPSRDYSFQFRLKQDMIRGKEENPTCIIQSWQYNGIEFYDFINGAHGTPPKVLEPRFKKLIENLISIPELEITEEMFLEYTSIGFGSLNEALS